MPQVASPISNASQSPPSLHPRSAQRATPAPGADRSHTELLWTGGWDSTFQLLRLLRLFRRRVTPFYLIDADRRSTGMELLTISRIKARLLHDYPDVEALLQPTRYYAVADIPPQDEIANAFRALREERFLGTQYEWLARFCDALALDRIQLCIHRDDKAYDAIADLVCDLPKQDRRVLHTPDNSSRAVSAERLFRHFDFPLLQMTKLQMHDIARHQGWADIMAMTWFCHRPTKGLRPCGTCNPCLYTQEEGLAWRIPPDRRAAALLYRRLVRPGKAVAKRILRIESPSTSKSADARSRR